MDARRLIQLLVLLACGDGGPDPGLDPRGSAQPTTAAVPAADSTTRAADASDSATAEPEAPTDEPAVGHERWALGEPLYSIGEADGAEPYLLSRVEAAFLLSDGSLVIANSGSRELRFYDRTGVHLRTVGREGRGPGEFAGMRNIAAIRGDTIVAYDPAQQRVTYFAPDGSVHETVPLAEFATEFLIDGQASHAIPTRLHFLRDGSYAIEPGFVTQIMTRGPNGVRRDSTLVYLYGRDGRERGVIGPLAAGETFVEDGSSMGFVYGHRFHMAAGADRLYIGTGKPGVVHIFSRDGRPIGSLEVGGPEVEVTEAALRDLIRRFRERAGPAGAEMVEAMTPPRTQPSYARILVDVDDRLWVQVYGPSDRPQEWQVVDPSGRMIATLEVPAGRLVQSARGDRVVTLTRDELGVERVHVHVLSRVR